MPQLTNNVVKPYLGLNKDKSVFDLGKGEYTFALNTVSTTSDGTYLSLSIEPGNILSSSVPKGYSVIGTIYGNDNEHYIFSTNNSLSEIGLYSNDKYTALVNSDLGFSTTNLISGEFRIKNGCERIIYWRDSLNSDRFFNRDKPEDFQTDGDWDPEKFKFYPDISTPDINLISVNDSGGFLPIGKFYFQIEYLDDNLNLIYRSPVSSEVIIYPQNSSNAYHKIYGGLNLLAFDSSIGGVPPTNKSITLEFSNLDTSYSFIRLNVLTNTSSDNLTTEAHQLGNLIPITDTTLQFNYVGFNPDNGDILIDASSLLIPISKYETSRVMEQVQGRLVRANVTENSRDYSKYQRIVNDIITTYVTDHDGFFSQDEIGNPKNPQSYWNNLSFPGDEIIAAGIVFYHSDGTESPAFHIPGREKIDGVDDIIIPYDSDSKDLKHLPIKSQYEKWEVYNTADSNGRLGYYEADQDYPRTLDCNDEYIYGSLAGTPVRHHRMPCRRTVPIYDTTGTNRIGLSFSNIIYPDSDIVGHRFVFVKRDEFTRTVLDTGILCGGPLVDGAHEFRRFTPVRTGDDIAVYLISPKALLEEYQNGDYFKINGRIVPSRLDLFLEEESIAEFDISGSSGKILTRTGFIELVSNIEPDYTDHTYVSYDGNVFVGPRTLQTAIQGFDNNINNQSLTNTINVYSLEDTITTINPITQIGEYFQVTNKKYRVPYGNVDNLKYSITHPNILTLTDTQEVYCGDVFISEIAVFEIRDIDGLDLFQGTLFSNDMEVFSRYINRTWVESEINFSLVHPGTGCNIRYFSFDNLHNYVVQRVADQAQDGEWLPRANICQEFYGYNKDYNVKASNNYIPLPTTFNYCSKCIHEHKTRVTFSPRSFDQELQDTYRVSLIDDFIDLPAHRGEVTGVKYKNNRLYVHTTETTFELQPNPQSIATDQNTAYLRTGDFLSIPPNEIMQSDTGYGGSSSQFSTLNTQYGYVWVDQENGQIFSMSNSVDELSLKNLSQWFKENLPSTLNSQILALTGSDYLYNNNFVEGVGVNAVFDPRYNRLIIHKRDYETLSPIQKYDPSNSYITPTFVYNTSTGKFALASNDNYEEVSLTDTSYFANKSWTISFSYFKDRWISWHSYLPDFLFYDKTNYYSVDSNSIYRHLHKNNYANFYTISFPHILEWVDTDQYQTRDLHALHYISTSKENGQVVDDKTFDQLLVYNDNETTGIVPVTYLDQHITPYGNIGNDNTYVIRTNDNYKISGIYDKSTSTIVATSTWDDVNSYFNVNSSKHGYIDFVPTNYDLNLSAYNIKELNSKFYYVRLIYTNSSNKDINIVTQLANTNSLISVR